MNGLLLIAALSLPAQTEPTSESPWRSGLSLGVGHDWAGVGVRGEVAYKSFSASASIGTLLFAPTVGIAVGLRWYPLGLVRHSLFLGPHAATYVLIYPTLQPALFAVAVTVGYRFQADHFFFEVSAGPAAAWVDVGTSSGPYEGQSKFQFGGGAFGGNWYIPDVGLAAGWRF